MKNFYTKHKIQNTEYRIQNTEYKLRGQSLLEALLAIALGVILIGGSIGIIGVALKTFNNARQYIQANSLVRQTAEVIISLARDNWHSVYDLLPGVHYKLAKQNNVYVFQKGEEKIFDSQGLVSYWAFDENGGTTAYDSQSTNNGTLVNGPTWQSPSNCVSGICLSFDGSNDYVNNSSISGLSTSAITMELWLKMGGQLSTYQHPIGVGGGHSATLYISRNSYNISWKFNSIGGVRQETYFGTIDTNWHHIVVTYDGSQINGYIDGVLKKSVSASGAISYSDNSLFIATTGSGSTPNSNYLYGLIDELRIYNRALSADEIKAHYQAGLDKLGLVSYWAFDENGGTTAYDSQSTNNGTLTNGPTWQSLSNCVSGICLSFDGSNDYVNNSSISGLSTSAITMELWLKMGGQLSTYQHPIGVGGGHSATLYISRNSYNISWKFNSIGGVRQETYFGTIDTNWHHIVVTYDGSQINGYIDGVLKKSVSASGAISYSDNSLFIATTGSGSTPNNNYLYGLIDEVRIYNRALSADEIAQRYRASYTKYFVTNKVSRTSGNIDTTYNSANDDPSTLQINSVVKYGSGLVSQQTGGMTDLRFYLTRSYNNQVFWQTDWSGGGGQTGPISNPGNKFDTADSNINYASTTGSIYMTTATTTVASLTSSILDTGVVGGAGFNSFLWQGSLGTGGLVQFQFAFSNSASGPWTYYGPTSTSDYYQPNPNVSVAFPTTGASSPQNYRYIRYKVYLSTSSTTPQINDIIINWSP